MSTGSGNEQRDVRISKLERLRSAGVNPFPERFERTHTLAQARSLPAGTAGVRIAGRLMTIRVMGRMSFATLQDQSGRCQISVQCDAVGEELYRELWKKLVDIGDFIGVEGSTMLTKTGEPTLAATSFTFLGKALRPLPEKWHGVQDTETCYRQRYLDLLMNRETMDRFLFRSKVISATRAYLEQHAFVEVDTPVLQTKASGAAAKPFNSHHNALDMEVFLRIAPETYLKRLIAGGFDRVYEFARCFRNEGMDPSHLQDFTMLEWYSAWWNYADNMRFTQALLQHVLQSTLGSLQMELRGRPVDFSGEWPRVSFRSLLLKDCGIDIATVGDADALRAAIRAKGLPLAEAEIKDLGFGNLVDQLYKKVSRPQLDGPVFLVDHPIDLSPLARRNDRDGTITDRFQLVVRGWEIVNAYSELTDPLDQRARFEQQASLKASGDAEAMEMDEDYLECMEHGMPPISGFGMGIDRLVCLLTNQENLRDVVLFPLMKPQ
ncbi:MAG: lysine--tRNA ligase [Planctomycetes bacterium]|nr:lysine--tRNA ligase [Planctomycetota bacterium]